MAGYGGRTRKSKRKKGRGGGRGAKNVTVKGHTRSPRGPNTGKPTVHVKRYRRRSPKT